jgi:hypothetical protein
VQIEDNRKRKKEGGKRKKEGGKRMDIRDRRKQGEKKTKTEQLHAIAGRKRKNNRVNRRLRRRRERLVDPSSFGATGKATPLRPVSAAFA